MIVIANLADNMTSFQIQPFGRPFAKDSTSGGLRGKEDKHGTDLARQKLQNLPGPVSFAVGLFLLNL